MTARHLIFRDFLVRNREHFPMTLEAAERHETARITAEQARHAYDVALEPLVTRGELRDIEPEDAP